MPDGWDRYLGAVTAMASLLLGGRWVRGGGIARCYAAIISLAAAPVERSLLQRGVAATEHRIATLEADNAWLTTENDRLRSALYGDESGAGSSSSAAGAIPTPRSPSSPRTAGDTTPTSST